MDDLGLDAARTHRADGSIGGEGLDRLVATKEREREEEASERLTKAAERSADAAEKAQKKANWAIFIAAVSTLTAIAALFLN